MKLKLFFLLLALNCLPHLPSTALAQADAPIKVGILIPMSGGFAIFGEAVRSGFELGLAKENTQNITTYYEDTAYDPKQAISAFRKLVDIDHVQLVVVFGTPITAAILPIASATNIPIFGWTPSERTIEGYSNILRLMSSADVQGEAAAIEMQRRGYKDVAVFSAANEYSQTVRDSFLRHADPARIIFKEEFLASEQDFRSVLIRAKRNKIGAISLCLITPQIAAFSNQARELGITAPIFGCAMLSSSEILRSAGLNLEGSWFISADISAEFARKYAEKVADPSGLWEAAAQYDLARMLSQLAAEKIPPAQFVNKSLGRCFENSGFTKNCIKETKGVKHFEVTLGVVNISRSQFVRSGIKSK